MSEFMAFLEVTLQLLGAPTHPCPLARRGGTKSPCQVPRGFAGAHTAVSHSPLPNCSLQSRLCLPAPSPGCLPQPPHTMPQASSPSWGEVRLCFSQSQLGALVLVLFSQWQSYANHPTLLCVSMSTSSSLCTCYDELSLTLQM